MILLAGIYYPEGYNLRTDPDQARNVIKKFPKVAKRFKIQIAGSSQYQNPTLEVVIKA